MKYKYIRSIDRRNTNCVKWDLNEMLYGKKDILSMWVADMDLEIPQEVTDALKDRIDHAAYGYTFASDGLRESIVSWEKNRHNWKIEKDWIMFSPGIVPGVNFFINCFTDKGDGIVIQTPVYYPFMNAINLNERKLVNNQLIYTDQGYEINFDQLEEQLSDPNTKMMIISSPHNPVGKVFSAEELSKMGELCADNNVLFISDEIHQDIIFKGYKHICASSLSEKIQQNTITCVAPSKTFNLAGLAFSALIIPNETLRENFRAYLATIGIHGSNLMGYTAGEAAYRHGGPWLDELLEILEDNIDYMDNFFKEHLPKIKMQRPQSTYLAWLDFSEYGLTQKELVDKMVKEAEIGLNDGSTFGPGGEGFMRINFACPRSTIEEAMKRMKNVF
ncbi:MAG: pyridoxal phosphate-dependent aminotransferase [Candidatus Delongbacteria bacterium]|jgi:cystathionine beta-lyase|nr:pyridoxal phosphate-dependent aminotransferase [Candidatus Delongbacteria bacterium]